jgi:hypothetical protein
MVNLNEKKAGSRDTGFLTCPTRKTQLSITVHCTVNNYYTMID